MRRRGAVINTGGGAVPPCVREGEMFAAIAGGRGERSQLHKATTWKVSPRSAWRLLPLA